MDAVFDAQFLNMKNSFAAQGIEIAVAYTPAGEVDYIYEVGVLLSLPAGPSDVSLLQDLLPGLRPVQQGPAPSLGTGLALYSIEGVEEGRLTVPQVLDLLDERLGDRNPALLKDGIPLASPNHIVHITRICPADEPQVPCGNPAEPCPPPCPAGDSKAAVRLGVSDTGLLADAATHPWLNGVTGELDPLGPVQLNGLPAIPEYTGHGTFVAGVARCMAPTATVYVNNHFALSGGERESVIIAKLEQLLADQHPDVVNLSAGTYTRKNWVSLGFTAFNQRKGHVTLVAAAGNDTTDRPFWPAAFSWAVSVGALGADQQNRAWFSNYGNWVDVYALGEGLVNAYATGVYTYQEPPKRPAQQNFTGMARWDGTSFSAPLVAGLIAAEMAGTGASALDAAKAVLQRAAGQVIPGVGPALYPCNGPAPR